MRRIEACAMHLRWQLTRSPRTDVYIRNVKVGLRTCTLLQGQWVMNPLNGLLCILNVVSHVPARSGALVPWHLRMNATDCQWVE